MTATDVRYVLPEDADLVPLPEAEEVLLSRRGSRTTPQLLSADAMRLLERFRTPATVTEAVLGYCAATGADPMTTVDEAFGVLVAATRAQLLVVEGSEAAAAVTDRLRVGQTVGPATIRARLRVLRDSEIWRAVLADGTPVVVKVVDEPVLGPDLVAREVAALRRLAVLAGGTVPRLHWHEVSATGGTLVLGEVVGDPVDLAVCVATPQARLQVVAAVLEAYVAIHDHGVLHGDVHPGNVLVRPDGGVTVLDFGLAAVAGAGLPPPPRPTGGEHLDPETAAALRDDLPFPPLDAAGEQYSVAALAYRLLTGAPHLDLACERHVALGRIVADAPRRFTAVGATPWPAGERALRRALSRRPRDRYESLAALRDAVARAVPAAVPAAPAAGRRLRAAVRALDVDGPAWAAADPGEAAHATWFLRRVAQLTGDVTAHDLAAVWAFRAGTAVVPEPPPDHALTAAHRLLADYCETGRDLGLRRARVIATSLGQRPGGRVDVHEGRWAGLLLSLECHRPADAVLPGRPDHAT